MTCQRLLLVSQLAEGKLTQFRQNWQKLRAGDRLPSVIIVTTVKVG
jgi:hypothetical protein